MKQVHAEVKVKAGKCKDVRTGVCNWICSVKMYILHIVFVHHYA